MKNTALTHIHESLGAKMVPFAGYNMPVQYEGVTAEHLTVRSAVGVFDVSHMGEFLVEGTEALTLLQKLTSNDVSKLAIGDAQYSCLPNDIGGIVDDLICYRLKEQTYLLVVNASNVEKDWNWIQKHNQTIGAELKDLSDSYSLLAIQGPKAIEAMQSLGLDQKSESVFNMIKDIDTDGSGELEFGEFLEMMTATLSNKTSEDDLRKVFNIFDSDRTGEISLMNLKKMSKELGEDMPFDELAEMIDRNDLDGDGRWSFEDFSEMITNKNASKYNRARAMAPVVKVQIRWEGKMNINKKWQEIEVDHMKIDQDGMMTGVGNDDEGKYEVTGTIKSDATVKIEKRYIGAHTYVFEGKIDKDGKIKGQWTVSNDDKQKGDFELRPTQAIWNGQFTEGKRKNSFSFVFAFVDGAAYGHGVDASGAFSIMGT